MERIIIKGRIHGVLSPAKQRQLEKVRAKIAEELPDLIRRNHMRYDARKEKTFSGMLRRAIHKFPTSSMEIAKMADIRWNKLSAFLTGEKALPSDAIDRLVKVLKLKIGGAIRKGKHRSVSA
jgi:hypothetical protein